MDRFEEEINEELNWRVAEIATLTKLVTLNDALNEEQEEVLKKHLISTFYAYWEGFVKDVAKIYLKHINELHLKFYEICPSLLVFAFDANIIKEYGKYSDFNKKTIKIDLIYENFFEEVNQHITLPTEIATSSNLNYKVLIEICNILNLDVLDTKYKESLNKLLRFRNLAAHGDFSCPTEELPIAEMRELVINLMSDMAIHLIDAYKNRVFTR